MTTLTYGKITHATYLVAAAVVLAMPDAVLGLALGLGHLVFELIHLLFELLESGLDHLVEHIFHTDPRETQVIVFYLLLALAAGSIYFLSRAIFRFFRMLKEKLQVAILHHKDHFLGYWAESATNKFKLIAGLNVALTVAYLVSF